MTRQEFINWYLNQVRNRQQAASPASSATSEQGGSNLSDILKALKTGKSAYTWGKRAYNLFNQGSTQSGAGGGAVEATPSVSLGSTPETGSMAYEASPYYQGATEYGTGATGATNVAGGSLGSEGLAGVSWGGAASLVAPLLATYLAYQAGSGANMPVMQQADVQEKARYLSDFIKNKGAVDKSQYNIPGFFEGNDKSIEKNPLSWLYSTMHDVSTGSGREINTGYNDTDIDKFIYDRGITPEELKAALGYDLPDWAKENWQQYTIRQNPLVTMGGLDPYYY